MPIKQLQKSPFTKTAFALLLALLLSFGAAGCTQTNQANTESSSQTAQQTTTYATTQQEESSKENLSLDSIPEYTSSPSVVLNNNTPSFSEEDLSMAAGTEIYSNLDSLGRCGAAFGIIGKETMPAEGEKRESISDIKPTGWHLVKYEVVGSGSNGYLFNRCHLLAWMLSAENANKKNLITGTRYLNVEGMLPYETQVSDYIKQTGNHVAMRVTPIFEGQNLVASGVQMEAQSVEDNGSGLQFNVYCYNVQDGVVIDYATGESCLAEDSTSVASASASAAINTASGTSSNASVQTTSNTKQTYILNTSSKKFHLESCSKVSNIKAKNKKTVQSTRADLILQNYSPCGVCNP